METFQVQSMIDDVARAKSDLMALALDDSVTPERLAKCEAAANDLETVVCEIIGTAWIPRDPTQLHAAIQCVHKNLQCVQVDVAAALDVVLVECKPDELYRGFIGLSFSRLLEFQLDVLMTTLAHSMQCSCGWSSVRAEEWAN